LASAHLLNINPGFLPMPSNGEKSHTSRPLLHTHSLHPTPCASASSILNLVTYQHNSSLLFFLRCPSFPSSQLFTHQAHTNFLHLSTPQDLGLSKFS
jgi:hypothetical protein